MIAFFAAVCVFVLIAAVIFLLVADGNDKDCKCSRCGRVNPKSARFCGTCGKRI